MVWYRQLSPDKPIIPAAVPQLGGTHQADENTLSRTSGNNVICRWTCNKFSTKANIAPIMNRTKPRTNSVVNFIDIAAPQSLQACNLNAHQKIQCITDASSEYNF